MKFTTPNPQKDVLQAAPELAAQAKMPLASTLGLARFLA
jgi:hypothetical protein